MGRGPGGLVAQTSERRVCGPGHGAGTLWGNLSGTLTSPIGKYFLDFKYFLDLFSCMSVELVLTACVSLPMCSTRVVTLPVGLITTRYVKL